MKNLCIFLSLSTSLHSQVTLKGIVSFQNSGSKPAVGVTIASFGANSTHTNNYGMFELEFPTKQAGDKVKLIVGSNDHKNTAIEVVNRKLLEEIHLPSRSDDDILEIVVCKLGQRDEAALRYYGILMKNAESTLKKQLDDIQRQLKENNLSDAMRQSLLHQITALTQENTSLKQRLEDDAHFIANINQDKALPLVKQAIQVIDSSGDIQAALKILDVEKLYSIYQQAKDKKTQAEAEMNQIGEALFLRYKLLFENFDEDNTQELLEISSKLIEIGKEDKVDRAKIDDGIIALQLGVLIKLYILGKPIDETIIKLVRIADSCSSRRVKIQILEFTSSISDMDTIGIFPKLSDKAFAAVTKLLQNTITAPNEALPLEELWIVLQFKKLNQNNNNSNELAHLLSIIERKTIIGNQLNDMINLADFYQESDKKLKIYEKCMNHTAFASLNVDNQLEIINKLYKSCGEKNVICRQLYSNKAKTITKREDSDATLNAESCYFMGKLYSDVLSNDSLAFHFLNKAITASISSNPFDKLKTITYKMSWIAFVVQHPDYCNIKNLNQAEKFWLSIKENKVFSNGTSKILLELGFEINEFEAALYGLRAIKYIEIKNYPSAAQDLDRFISIFPDNLIGEDKWAEVGLCYYHAGKYNKAIHAYTQQKKYATTLADTYYNNIGTALVKNKQFKEAKINFIEYQKLQPTNGRSERNWAMYYALQNKKSKAITHLQKAVEMGFTDLEWITKDDSMHSIREETAYKKIVESLKNKK